ncbi:MAG TPA: phage holin family protein [Solirubrobacteraceae bacterium]|nr:phage holin family protein [Solirubrobacteraceae bacterium]
MPAENGQPDSIATAITEVSENLTKLVHDEIELAKAEVTQKGLSLLRGAGAVAAGAVFGVFAVIFVLITIALALNSILVSGVPNIWIGFVIVTGALLLLTLFSFLFAWRKLKVGAPTPTMAIDEAKRIRETVASSTGKGS